MRIKWLGLFLLGLFLLPVCAAAEEANKPDAWTVLIYMCGSDLESKYSYGTANLEEIASVELPNSVFGSRQDEDGKPLPTAIGKPRQVNVLVETGGAREWHADELGMDIRSDVLQDWEFRPGRDGEKGSFLLKNERPLASMADPNTLADFIHWGAEKYPAEKYMLVLWDHGGGSATGILIDELFDGAYMTLDLLDLALQNGGVHFEAVLFDACLMANIETACAIQDHANWMIASEELVAGKGTAFGAWLQELYYVPVSDGRMLGRWICDTSMIKYANSEDDQAQDLLTWSVINLSKVKDMEESFDMFFETMRILYAYYPQMMATFSKTAHFYENFGTGRENMYDLGSMMFDPVFRTYATSEMQMKLQENLAAVVDYCVRGSGRSAARGISFCYATNFTPDRLDVYAKNCPSPNYLAILDAISPWEAPDRVYDEVKRVPEPADSSAYQVQIEKKIWENGSPAFRVTSGDANVSMVLYTLYRKDELTGEYIKLGRIPVYYDEEQDLFRVYDLLKWPAIDGNLCQLELQNVVTLENPNVLYNVPVMVDSETMNMRCVYWFNKGEYEIFGLWEDYDSDSSQFNRNVKSLSQVAGQEFSLLYEVLDGGKGRKPTYLPSPSMVMYRALRMEEMTLPPGDYLFQFTIVDAFMREMPLDTMALTLDGEKASVSGEAWRGTVTLDPREYYGY